LRRELFFDPGSAMPPSICMVYKDSATNYMYNVVYWANTYSNSDSFIVYRYDNSSGMNRGVFLSIKEVMTVKNSIIVSLHFSIKNLHM